MGLFGRKKTTTTKSPSKRQELENEKIKVEIANLKREESVSELLNAELIDRVKKDESLYRAVVESRYKIQIKDVPKESVEDEICREELRKDPEYREAVKKARIAALQPKGVAVSKLEERVAARAEELLAEDPTYLDKVAKQKLNQVISGATDNRFGTFMSNYKAFKEMEAELGGEKPAGGDHFWGDVVGGLVKALPDALPLFLSRGEMPRARQLPVGQGAAVETAVVQQPLKSADQDQQKKTLSISSWLVYLEKEPKEFVDALAEQIELDDEGAGVTVKILCQYKNSDELLAFLSLFESRMPEEAKEALGKLREKKEWVESVMKLVKERFGKQES
jgi:hypothetical protein